jgi:hypothetical protein
MRYLCTKDWDLKGTVYFKKNKSYNGRMVKTVTDNRGQCIKMIGENNMRIKFEAVNENFVLAK